MERNGIFDLDASSHQFCISWFTLRVVQVGTTMFVRSWNEHPIPSNFCSFDCMQNESVADEGACNYSDGEIESWPSCVSNYVLLNVGAKWFMGQGVWSSG